MPRLVPKSAATKAARRPSGLSTPNEIGATWGDACGPAPSTANARPARLPNVGDRSGHERPTGAGGDQHLTAARRSRSRPTSGSGSGTGRRRPSAVTSSRAIAPGRPDSRSRSPDTRAGRSGPMSVDVARRSVKRRRSVTQWRSITSARSAAPGRHSPPRSPLRRAPRGSRARARRPRRRRPIIEGRHRRGASRRRRRSTPRAPGSCPRGRRSTGPTRPRPGAGPRPARPVGPASNVSFGATQASAELDDPRRRAGRSPGSSGRGG